MFRFMPGVAVQRDSIPRRIRRDAERVARSELWLFDDLPVIELVHQGGRFVDFNRAVGYPWRILSADPPLSLLYLRTSLAHDHDVSEVDYGSLDRTKPTTAEAEERLFLRIRNFDLLIQADSSDFAQEPIIAGAEGIPRLKFPIRSDCQSPQVEEGPHPLLGAKSR